MTTPKRVVCSWAISPCYRLASQDAGLKLRSSTYVFFSFDNSQALFHNLHLTEIQIPFYHFHTILYHTTASGFLLPYSFFLAYFSVHSWVIYDMIFTHPFCMRQTVMFVCHEHLSSLHSGLNFTILFGKVFLRITSYLPPAMRVVFCFAHFVGSTG